jgi:hypothetical protein
LSGLTKALALFLYLPIIFFDTGAVKPEVSGSKPELSFFCDSFIACIAHICMDRPIPKPFCLKGIAIDGFDCIAKDAFDSHSYTSYL